jgi:hypothetical protein
VTSTYRCSNTSTAPYLNTGATSLSLMNWAKFPPHAISRQPFPCDLFFYSHTYNLYRGLNENNVLRKLCSVVSDTKNTNWHDCPSYFVPMNYVQLTLKDVYTSSELTCNVTLAIAGPVQLFSLLTNCTFRTKTAQNYHNGPISFYRQEHDLYDTQWG